MHARGDVFSGSDPAAHRTDRYGASGVGAPTGKVWFVGAGPGAADLLTVRAIRVLACADVVLHDALLSDEVLGWARSAQRVSVGKRCGRPSTPQDEIGRLLIAHAQAHAQVVRLKGGDPGVFGRLDEEIEALDAAGIPWEIVPGVTAASTAAAAAGHSLTRREVARHLTIATPRVARNGQMAAGWADGIDPKGTAVLYMAGGLAAQSAAALLDRGFALATPVVAVHAASWPDEQVSRTTLGALSRNGLSPDPRPVVLMVGQAVAVRTSPQEVSRPPELKVRALSLPAHTPTAVTQTLKARLQSAPPSACAAAACLENSGRSQESPVPATQPLPA